MIAPTGGWTFMGDTTLNGEDGPQIKTWRRDGIMVQVVPSFGMHVIIAAGALSGELPSNQQVERVLADFGAIGAVETPGHPNGRFFEFKWAP